MSNSELIGKEHNAHLNWLLNTWMNSNSPVCFLEGFPGTGKTTIARELLANVITAKLTAVMITAPETEKDPTDDLLLALAAELNSAGRDELAKAIENNRPLLDVLSNIVENPILIIIDEFQRSMQGSRAITMGGFAKVLSKIANQKWLKGRFLLLTNRIVERARWSEPYAIRTLTGMSPDDGVELLEHLAREWGRIDEIPPESHRDVVKWLGGNPGAIRLLVGSLAYESLEDLIGVKPELWEMRDREVSPELIEELERELLEKTFSQLPDDYVLHLNRLSVFRKPFKRQAIENLFDEKSTYAQFKHEMIDRFLMEHHRGWFNLHSIVREIGLQKLSQASENLQQAHSIAARYYTRHFEAKQIVGWGALGGHFVEARFHLVKSGKIDALKNIASRFQSYIFSTLSETSAIPRNAEELDERIAVLSALLETPGRKSLEYHLARLFYARNLRNDLRRALHHIHRAKSNSDYVPAWLLCGEILYQMERHDEAVAVLKQGIDRIPPDKNLVDLYNRCAQLLAQMKRYDEAIVLLKQGIDRIPPDKGLVSLYIQCGKLLAHKEQYGEAIEVLKQGIDRIPLDKRLVNLYDSCARLLTQMKRYDEAVAVLKQGIGRIPLDKSLVDLYNTCAQLLAQIERYDEAIELLRQGIRHIPFNKGAWILYYSYGEILEQKGQYKEAIAVLKQGIARTPEDVPLYTRCSELLFQFGQKNDAIALLRQGIDSIPPEKDASLIYSHYVKLLVASHQTIKAVDTLLNGIIKMREDHRTRLVEFLLLLYAALRDEKGIIQFMQTIRGIQSAQIALAQTLLYQIQERWIDAAKYAEQKRTNGLIYPALVTEEAFSWLCTKQPKHALNAISATPEKKQFHNHWLYAFIQLKLNNFEEAKEALVTCDYHATSLQDVNEAILLTLWDQPSNPLEQYDLAYYFPTLPGVLTGLPQSVTRIPFHPSVMSNYLKNNNTSSNHFTQQQKEKQGNINTKKVMPMPETYIDFDLHIELNGHAVASSPEGEVPSNISTQLPSNIRLSLQLIERRQTDADLLKEAGQALYDWLFPHSIHTHLQQTEAVSRRDKAKLRLRLRIEAATIASLPLEFIYRAAGGYFLAVNPDTVLSRYLNLPLPPERVRRREGPLHMLAIIADPSDQVRLDPNEWESIIKEAIVKPLTDKQMTLKVVKRATRKEIRNALLEQQPDIIQFVGHGIYQNSKGSLALVDENTGKTWPLGDERFANLFMGHDDHLGLVVMATCESAQSDDPQSFLGIAPQLVQRGTPAVVAMQYAVYVKTAKVFLEDFYASVAARKPIDWAVQSARNAVSLEFGLDNREFATPVLYMRAQDGNVF